MTKDEIPPEYLWEDGRGLELWWAEVEERREARYGTSNGSPSATGDAHPAPELVENDLARALRDR